MTAMSPAPVDPAAIVADAEKWAAKLVEARSAVAELIFGQETVVERALTTVLAGGHGLLVGVPGLAKTKLVDTMGTVLGLSASRIQFTPDLMPSDILGSEILDESADHHRSFRFVRGPVFAQLLMADEINRASPRTQSALLQSMQEHFVTIAGQRHDLPAPFHVLATQNPIEQEGTYPLPEAQMDRFLMKVVIGYPSDESETKILQLVRGEDAGTAKPSAEKIPQQVVLDARAEVLKVFVAPELEKYFVTLIAATRRPEQFGPNLKKWIQVGASPRGTLALDRASRAFAWLAGRDHATPDDVRAVAHDCLRHRVILSYEASAESVTPEQVITEVIKQVAIP